MAKKKGKCRCSEHGTRREFGVNEWACPGCSTPVVYKGYGRRGKYCIRECRLTHEKELRRIARSLRPPRIQLSKRKKFLSLFCKQCGEPLPKYAKLYCSQRCNYLSKYQRKKADRVPPPREAAKTARNVEEAGSCSICGNTLARSGWYKVTPHPMIPQGIELCATHRRSFGSFVSANNYQDKDIDEVWTAFLVRLTFPNAGGQPYLVMMREAFHA